MAKNKKKPAPLKKTEPAKLTISPLQQNLIFIAVIIIYLVILMKPLVIDGLSPKGVDVVASRGQTNMIREYNATADDEALWNPAIFSGMPIYHRLGAKAFSLDYFINWFAMLFSTPFAYYLLGALGMFMLLRYLKLIPLISFLATMFFILMPHYSSLYLEGHFAKMRAVMYIPWIILCFIHFLDKRNLLAAALFALSFGLQIRTQHYQIVFYTALLIFALGVYPIIKDLLDKKFTLFTKSALLVVAAVTLAITMAAQPLFLAREYLPYSKRGKTTIDLNQPEIQTSQDPSAGVTIDYATQWSTHPSEMLTWLMPRFYGGMSGEKYTGSEVPALKNRMIPGYWGFMPFTQSYEYMGVITIFLALIGIYAYRRDRRILAMMSIGLFFILLSFGRHFLSFYEVFFNYVPFFNKFRAPMMSVTVTGLIIAILAAYGMNYLYTIHKEEKYPELKNVLIIAGSLIGLGILILIFSQGFSYIKSGEAYEPQVQNLLIQVRQEFFSQDLIRYFLLSVVCAGMVFAFYKRKVTFAVLAGVLLVIGLLDLTNIQLRYSRDFVNTERMERQFFKKSTTDEFILSDSETFRIMPPPSEMNSNRWAYHHQIIGGYSPIKMYTVEELIQNCFNQSVDGQFPLNWNVIRMFNVKYMVLNQQIAHANLVLVHSDQRANQFTYLLRNYLPRGFFVAQHKVIADQYDRLNYINNASFDPGREVILEKEPEQTLITPDSTIGRLTGFTPNRLEFDVFTDQPALFVISESFYPPGWKLYIDQQQVTEVLRANHSMHAVVVPAGKHVIELRFDPDSFHNNLTLARISSAIILLVILISLGLQIKNQGFPFWRAKSEND